MSAKKTALFSFTWLIKNSLSKSLKVCEFFFYGPLFFLNLFQKLNG